MHLGALANSPVNEVTLVSIRRQASRAARTLAECQPAASPIGQPCATRFCLGIEPALRVQRQTDRATLRTNALAWRRALNDPAIATRVTQHNEFQLIRDNDPAAAIALGLSLVGFVLPVVSAIAHSANVVDCLIWSLIALIVQIIVYFIVKIPVPNLSARIAAGELAAAIWLGLSSMAAGALNAACMIY